MRKAFISVLYKTADVTEMRNPDYYTEDGLYLWFDGQIVQVMGDSVALIGSVANAAAVQASSYDDQLLKLVPIDDESASAISIKGVKMEMISSESFDKVLKANADVIRAVVQGALK